MENTKKYLAQFINQMAQDHKVEVQVIFDEAAKCSAAGDKTWISFGMKYINHVFETYAAEYVDLRWLWDSVGGVRDLKEYKALWMICIHEFAHILQRDATLEKIHTAQWIENVTYLKNLYPYIA